MSPNPLHARRTANPQLAVRGGRHCLSTVASKAAVAPHPETHPLRSRSLGVSCDLDLSDRRRAAFADRDESLEVSQGLLELSGYVLSRSEVRLVRCHAVNILGRSLAPIQRFVEHLAADRQSERTRIPVRRRR